MGASWSGAAKDDGTYDSTHDDDAYLSCEEPEPVAKRVPKALDLSAPLSTYQEPLVTPAGAPEEKAQPLELTPSKQPERRAQAASPGTDSPSRWKKTTLRIDVEEAGKAALPPAPPLSPGASPGSEAEENGPAPSGAVCFFSPVPAKGEGAVPIDDVELHLLGYSPATSTLRSAKNGQSAHSAASSGKQSRGTPRAARVLGNFGFHAGGSKAQPPLEQAERLIVIL
jgi:hypothetical protein